MSTQAVSVVDDDISAELAAHDDLDEVKGCDNCCRVVEGNDVAGGLETPAKYFSETPCGLIRCDWCREVHQETCTTCQEDEP